MNPAFLAIPAALGLSLLIALTSTTKQEPVDSTSATATKDSIRSPTDADQTSVVDLVPLDPLSRPQIQTTRKAQVDSASAPCAKDSTHTPTDADHPPVVGQAPRDPLSQTRFKATGKPRVDSANTSSQPSPRSPNFFGPRLQSEQWLGIEFGIGSPTANGRILGGLSYRFENSHKSREWDTLVMGSSQWNRLERTLKQSASESGLRGKIGYEHWIQTPSSLIITARASLEATWSSAESTSTSQSDTLIQGYSQMLTRKGTPQSTSYEQSSSEFGPRLGIGLRFPAFSPRLHLVSGVESGISWRVTHQEADSSRTAGWRSTPFQWSLGIDWVF